MSLNLKLQTYRGTRLKLLGGPGGANPSPTVAPSTPGMLIYTTDSQEVYVDTGSAFQRLAPDQQVFTTSTISGLAALSQIGGGNALPGDLAIVAGNATYLLNAYPNFAWAARRGRYCSWAV